MEFCLEEDIEIVEGGGETDLIAADVNETVHKVYTLEDGTPVTLIEDDEVEEEPVVVGDSLNVPKLDIVSVNGDVVDANGDALEDITNGTETITSAGNVTETEVGIFPTPVEEDDDENAFTLIDFEMFQDLDWYDEVDEDGKEYRLSEQLADSVWEEEKEEEDEAPLTYEEYTERAAEIIEAAENEILETAEILNAVPGSETLILHRKRQPEWRRP